MTREEQAIEYIKKYRELDEKLYNTAPKGTVSSIATKKCLEFWDMAISALEKQSIYDDGEHYVTISKALYDRLNTDYCDDAVSREAVLAKKIYTETEEGWSGYTVNADYIEQLPSVTVRQTDNHLLDGVHAMGYREGYKDAQANFVRQTGVWIKEKINDYSYKVYCSSCGKHAIMEYISTGDTYSASGHGEIKKTKYCPNCGAKMVEPQESEKVNCKSIKCENCINHNYCDFEPQESEK